MLARNSELQPHVMTTMLDYSRDLYPSCRTSDNPTRIESSPLQSHDFTHSKLFPELKVAAHFPRLSQKCSVSKGERSLGQFADFPFDQGLQANDGNQQTRRQGGIAILPHITHLGPEQYGSTVLVTELPGHQAKASFAGTVAHSIRALLRLVSSSPSFALQEVVAR